MLQITPSDREALRLLATGYSKDDVAMGLGISTREMETRLTKLFAAMGAATQAEAIAAAQRRGLLA
jgi:DNA-binding CsgD family transcriptional regulator